MLVGRTVLRPLALLPRAPSFRCSSLPPQQQQARVCNTEATNPKPQFPATVFDKIIKGELPATIVHEDELCIAFRDVSPQAPHHILVVPKNHQGLTGIREMQPEHKTLVGHLVLAATQVARKEGLHDSGYRLVINEGAHGCQSVLHLHLHVLGGRQLTWPPG